MLPHEQVRRFDQRFVRKERIDRRDVGRHLAEHGVEGTPRRREGPACALEVVGRQHDDAVVAVVARDKEGACDEVGGNEVMRHGEAADFARRDVQLLRRSDRLDEDAVVAVERRDAGLGG